MKYHTLYYIISTSYHLIITGTTLQDNVTKEPRVTPDSSLWAQSQSPTCASCEQLGTRRQALKWASKDEEVGRALPPGGHKDSDSARNSVVQHPYPRPQVLK